MQIRTYTGLWNVENRLYKFYDITLPFPVSVKQIGLALGTFVPWLFLMHAFGVSFAPPFGSIIWLAPPGFLTWIGNKPVAEGKTLLDYCISQISYIVNSKTYVAMTPQALEETTYVVEGRYWRRRALSK